MWLFFGEIEKVPSGTSSGWSAISPSRDGNLLYIKWLVMSVDVEAEYTVVA